MKLKVIKKVNLTQAKKCYNTNQQGIQYKFFSSLILILI